MRLARTAASYERENARLAAEKEALLKEAEQITYQFLGMLTRSWAGLEIMLDMVNWSLASHQDNRERFPVSLGRKIAFFRAAHNRIPSIAAFREEAAGIADGIMEASKTRHKLIHGFVQGDLRGKTFTMLIHSVPKGENSHMLYTGEVTVEREELFVLSRAIDALNKRLLAHAEVMIPALAGGQQDDPAS